MTAAPVRLADYPTLGAFLSEQLTGVLALPIDKSGTVHAAALRYWHDTDPLVFYLITARDTEKCALLRDGSTVKAAYVVGTEEDTTFSLQMRGSVRIVDGSAHRAVLDDYFKQHGEHGPDPYDAQNVLLEFKPAWARFTDYTKGYDRTFVDVRG